jgi:hypothetical protein
LTKLQRYLLGDLNHDERHSLEDFAAFRQAYDAAHGAGALAAMSAIVPEPGALELLSMAVAWWTQNVGRARLLSSR